MMNPQDQLQPPSDWNPNESDEHWLGCVKLLKDANNPKLPTNQEFDQLWGSIRAELDRELKPAKPDQSNQKTFGGWLEILFFEGGPYAQLSRFAAVFLAGFFITTLLQNPSASTPNSAVQIAEPVVAPVPAPKPSVKSAEPATEPAEVASVQITSPSETQDYIIPVDLGDVRYDLTSNSQLAMNIYNNRNLEGLESKVQPLNITTNSNSPFAKQRLLNSLQQMKFDSYVEDNPEELNRIREIESNVAILLREDLSVPNSEVYSIELFQQGDKLLQEKNYTEAIRYFQQCRELVPGSFLAFLAQFRIATVKFEFLQQFDDALYAYKETLEEYPAHFLSGDQKRYIISQLNLLEDNKQPNWEALGLWLDAKHGSSKMRDESLIKIIERHPSLPIATKSAAMLTEELIQGTCLLDAKEIAATLQEAANNASSTPQGSALSFYQGEILFRKLFEFQQAKAAYERVKTMPSASRYEAQVNNRLAQLHSISLSGK